MALGTNYKKKKITVCYKPLLVVRASPLSEVQKLITNKMSKFKAKKVLANNNLPTSLPIWSTITCWLALEHWNAPQWLYGALGLFFLIAWVVCIVGVVTEEKVDLLKNDDK